MKRDELVNGDSEFRSCFGFVLFRLSKAGRVTVVPATTKTDLALALVDCIDRIETLEKTLEKRRWLNESPDAPR